MNEQSILYACFAVPLEPLDALQLAVHTSPVRRARLTRIVGVVIGPLGRVAEGLRAAVEDATGRGGGRCDEYDGEQADEVLPGREETGRGLGGGREGVSGRLPRRTRRHGRER